MINYTYVAVLFDSERLERGATRDEGRVNTSAMPILDPLVTRRGYRLLALIQPEQIQN